MEGWNFDPNKGILFKANSLFENGSTYIKKTFSSYNRSSGKPSLTVTYTTSGAQTLSDDTYYLNNMETGKYLRYASSTATAVSGMLSSLGNSIRWEVRQVDGGYAIRSASDPTKYLSVSSNPSITTVGVTTVQNALIPSTCKWKITPVGGLLLKSAYNNAYLYLDGTTLKTSTALGTVGTSTYNSRVWRCASISYYGNTSSSTRRELSSFSVDTLILNVGETKAPAIHASPSNALWADAEDFTYTTSSYGYVSIDNLKHTIQALKTGSVMVTATHKVTGGLYQFKANVCLYSVSHQDFFDNGFLTRSQLTVAEAKDYISAYNLFARNIYSSIGINISFAIPNLYTSIADTCSSGYTSIHDLDAECNCFMGPFSNISDCRHKNNRNMLADFREHYTATKISSFSFWTGHKTWEYNGAGEYVPIISGAFTSSGMYIMFLNKGNGYVKDNFLNQKALFYTVVHELGHTLGLPDSYCSLPENQCQNNNCPWHHPETSPYGRQCVMANRRYIEDNLDILQPENWFCDYCKSQMINYFG